MRTSHMLMFLTALLCTSTLMFSSSAFAQGTKLDAHHDIFEIRRGELPVRHRLLGWTEEGHVAMRQVLCDEGGTTQCIARIDIIGGDGFERSWELLDINEVYCHAGEPCEALDRDVAVEFIRAERNALASLDGALTPGAPADRALQEASILGEAPELSIRTVTLSSEDWGEEQRADLVLKARGSRDIIGVVYGPSPRVEDYTILETTLSPDGERMAVVVDVTYGFMCYSGQRRLTVVVFDIGHHTARLANTVGFRAYKAGDYDVAYRAFVEATSRDEGYALGWFNRGGLESLDGDLSQAAESLERAITIDSKMRARACQDRDFTGLLTSKRATASMRCEEEVPR